MAHKYDDVIMAWLDGKAIQRYTPYTNTWDTWEQGFDRTPSFESGEWRRKPEEKSFVEEAGITKEDLLAYFDEQNLYNDRNGLILRLNEDDGTDIPKCKVAVGNSSFEVGELVWCDLSKLNKIFPLK